MKRVDACVIGGGPAGLTAALYLLRSGLTLAFVEKLAYGGQMILTERIENYPAFPGGIASFELADRMWEQIREFAPEGFELVRDEVRSIDSGPDGHRVCLGDGWIEARVVIICSGARYRHMNLPGEERLAGRGVSYCALCDGNFFRDQTVAVIGGGNAAMEESLYLSRLVSKLYLIHRRDEFRATKCYQDRCGVNPKISILRSSVVTEIKGESKVEGIRVRNLKTSEEQDLAVDGIFIFIGFEPVHGFLPKEITLDGQGFIITDAEMRTTIPGIFAAGDVRSKTTRQVSTAVGDGATAASSAITYLESLHV